MRAIFLNITENKPIDFCDVYNDYYKDTIERWIQSTELDIKNDEREIKDYIPTYNVSEDERAKMRRETEEKILRRKGNIVRYTKMKKSIADYDKNLAETIRRHADRLNAEYNAWRAELVKKHWLDKLAQTLRERISLDYMQMPDRGER